MTPKWTADGRMIDPTLDDPLQDLRDIRAPHDGDGPKVEYHEAKTPHGRSGKRSRSRLVARMAAKGWRVHSIRSGGLFGPDVILFERDV